MGVAQVLFIFEWENDCWLFVSYYEPAHKQRQRQDWYCNMVPNWVHLKEMAHGNSQKCGGAVLHLLCMYFMHMCGVSILGTMWSR